MSYAGFQSGGTQGLLPDSLFFRVTEGQTSGAGGPSVQSVPSSASSKSIWQASRFPGEGCSINSEAARKAPLVDFPTTWDVDGRHGVNTSNHDIPNWYLPNGTLMGNPQSGSASDWCAQIHAQSLGKFIPVMSMLSMTEHGWHRVQVGNGIGAPYRAGCLGEDARDWLCFLGVCVFHG